MSNIKVFKMNDYEWWASKWNKEETNEFYKKEIGEENSLEEIRECDLDKEGMWWNTGDKEDIEKLGDNDEIISVEVVDGITKRKTKFGDLQRQYSEIYKFIPLREALVKHGDFTEPFCIAGTEW